ncbi:putative necrosis-inducing factor-domain-containing protein [Cladorrhinum samala]|uniref:Necrosis-inducing factor-domain-containing protein n=1 Tax=Cladorrhinum samala TaxID=585594 RepID=A0AAV9H8D4_9PEZI|nr:putative necrosis-inducing factor-domain-containing protein [Cladorrhinum samala]
MKLSKKVALAVAAFFAATGQAKTNCKNFTYKNYVSNASPTVEDCEELYRQLGDKSMEDLDWSIGDIQSKLAYHKTCYVGGQRIEHGRSKIGNQDLRTIIRNSIDKYKAVTEHGIERVGTGGWMQCGPNIYGDQINWGIYHSP